PGVPEHSFPIAWDGISVAVGDGDLGASLDKLAADALSLGSISLHAAVGEGGLSGAPTADVLGAHLDAAKLNALLGQPLLSSDVDLEAHLRGEASKPAVTASVKTA